MSNAILEPARAIPVLDEVEVLVVGGGVSGCAAAWAAAKAGARTILLERNGCLGGVATATGMANIGNFFLLTDGTQVIHGFAGLLVDRLVAAGAASSGWKNRSIPGVCIDSERLKVVLIDMLQDAGVTILTHALGARPVVEDGKVLGAYLESKAGRQAILAKATVDATGEADLAFQAGADFHTEQGGSASTLFRLSGVNIDAFVDFLALDPAGFPAGMDFVKDCATFVDNWKKRGVLFFPHGGGGSWRLMKEIVAAGRLQTKIGPCWGLDALGLYASAPAGFVAVNSNFYTIETLDIRRLSEYELHAQQMCYYLADVLRREVPGFESSKVASVGVDLGVRTSRCIRGRSTMSRKALADASAPVLADDVIGLMPVMDSTCSCGEYFRQYASDVPFGVTVPRGCANLLVGSAKSISTEPRGVLRGMAGCMICGQATGAASALAAKKGIGAADLPARELQRELLRQGVYLGGPERLASLGLA